MKKLSVTLREELWCRVLSISQSVQAPNSGIRVYLPNGDVLMNLNHYVVPREVDSLSWYLATSSRRSRR